MIMAGPDPPIQPEWRCPSSSGEGQNAYAPGGPARGLVLAPSRDSRRPAARIIRVTSNSARPTARPTGPADSEPQRGRGARPGCSAVQSEQGPPLPSSLPAAVCLAAGLHAAVPRLGRQPRVGSRLPAAV